MVTKPIDNNCFHCADYALCTYPHKGQGYGICPRNWHNNTVPMLKTYITSILTTTGKVVACVDAHDIGEVLAMVNSNIAGKTAIITSVYIYESQQPV